MRSCVRSRKLLTRASGTRLASRLRRNKFWDFWDIAGGSQAELSHCWGHFGLSWPMLGAPFVKLWAVVRQIVGSCSLNCGPFFR